MTDIIRHKLCELEDLPEGDMMGVQANGYEIIVLNVGGDIKAYYGLCPHALSRLEEGDFDGEILVCSAHLWEFDAQSGDSVNPSGSCLPSFPVQVEDGEIYVELPNVLAREWALNNLRYSV